MVGGCNACDDKLRIEHDGNQVQAIACTLSMAAGDAAQF